MKKENNEIKRLMKYAFENKKGYVNDLLKEFSEETFDSLRNVGMITKKLSIDQNKDSWKITKSGYEWYLTINPQLKYKHWTTKVNDFINYWLHYKWIKKEYLENQKRKDKYFKD